MAKHNGTADHDSFDTGTIDIIDTGPVANSIAQTATMAAAAPAAGAVTIEGTGGDDTLVVTATGATAAPTA